MAENMLRFLFRRFFKRRDLERELNDELASHIAMETARHVQNGESPEAARQIALREFGNSVDSRRSAARLGRGGQLNALPAQFAVRN